MPAVARLQGNLQVQIMHALWGLGAGTVDQVREALPEGDRSAYTTIQTVMNRLADRGLLDRRRSGKSIEYSPRVSETEYVSGYIRDALADASSEARQAAIVEIIGGLDDAELGGLQRRVRQIARRREQP
jgi:predicted transcriptional regulator